MAERHLHPANGSDDLRTVLLALAIVLATVAIGAFAGGGAVREEPVATAPPMAGPSVAAAGPADCAEWTNGCVVCRQTAQGSACSTPGIACTRGAISCLRR